MIKLHCLNKANYSLSSHLGYDPSEVLFGLSVDPKPSNALPGARKPRSWFGPNGLYIRELPCPSCRGRGYIPCTESGIERSRSDCSQCNGIVHVAYLVIN